jgi:hypothetical protein
MSLHRVILLVPRLRRARVLYVVLHFMQTHVLIYCSKYWILITVIKFFYYNKNGFLIVDSIVINSLYTETCIQKRQ